MTQSLPVLSVSSSLRLPLVNAWLGEIKPRSIIEAGAGMGAMACRLAMHHDYLGFEPDQTSFEAARDRLTELGRGRIERGVVPDQARGSYDLLVAFEVLEHLENDVETLRSWSRWLNPGGHVLISVPAHAHRYGPMDELVGHHRRYERAELGRLLHGAGFETVAIQSWGMPAGYLIEFIRNQIARRRANDGPVGTPGSGRLLQPPPSLRRLISLITLPLTWLQHPFRSTDLGVGYVAVGRLTAEKRA